MNAKQYRIQRDAAWRKQWRVEGLVKDILNYIGSAPMENESPDCYAIRRMIIQWQEEAPRG